MKETQAQFHTRYEKIAAELRTWDIDGGRLQRVESSMKHHLLQAYADHAVVSGASDRLERFFQHTKQRDIHPDVLLLTEAHDFIVEHDWARAFENAEGYEKMSFRLPYDVCLFEFKLGGRYVLVISIDRHDGTCSHNLWARMPSGWVSADNGGIKADFKSIIAFFHDQIAAICIALDSEAAETVPVRAPHKLVEARKKLGRVPPSDYHVVSLARQVRSALVPSDRESEHGKIRLHFRRGHWRHFDGFKSWVKWCLVGNPDLGFVDKEYRL